MTISLNNKRGSNQYSLFKNLSYDWNFINHCGGDVYPEKATIERNVTKWNIPVGYPDHALFTFVVDI